ncbi:hypothetical protein A1O1_08575 [Capronia coronata CBS 617.96]|uniref:Amidohydrolase-related domain-containing protein n=1 Tax=Capronia coronata CBS 617.96 TaxID=1182541 RepID=W9XSX8_9EURO|nr:uncharacterized protein A1O1_08575 [Capronia coronata CBS 617.96]EXJ80430.1 hypothetical protein A1O1_08575 [Capronia coronata CBS 617.96]
MSAIVSSSGRPTFSKASPLLRGKIALEEHSMTDHFDATKTLPDSENTSEHAFNDEAYMSDVVKRLADVESRVKDMDASGIDISCVSLTMPGIEGIFDAPTAVSMARKVNDQLHKTYRTGPHAHRFRVWGCVPMQDPEAAAAEAERCIKQLGCCGILINGHSNIGGPNTIQYLDEPQCEPFWAKIHELDVPVYLHPRLPAPDQQRAFRGYDFLLGSAYAFGRETAEHALRLMVSGLFDRYPNCKVILGHCGEGLPFTIHRVDHRLRHSQPGKSGPHKHPLAHYLNTNFWATCSGVQREGTLLDTIREMGEERVLFSVDYPYEDMQELSAWFDGLQLSENTRKRVGFLNARALLKLD